MCGISPAFLYATLPLCGVLGILIGCSFAIDSYPPEGLPRTRVDHVKASFAWLSGFCLTGLVVFLACLLLRAVWNLMF